MLGVALEGGAARGAYHMGVVKALLESGLRPDGYVGTSIGAVNAAILAQGDFLAAWQLWSTMSGEQLFDAEAEHLLNIGETPFDLKLTRASLERVWGTGGVDTSKMRAVLSGILDEDKLRAAGKDFGLVTIALSDRKTGELFLEDIPRGKLLDYIMASAAFPGFQPAMIDGKLFLDGGLSNNCPVNMLLDKGYHEIIAVRTRAPGLFRPIPKTTAKVDIIEPSRDLGNIMSFAPARIARNMNLGYFDGLRYLHGLKGRAFYITPSPGTDFVALLVKLGEPVVRAAAAALRLGDLPWQRLLFEGVLPAVAEHLKLPQAYDYEDIAVALAEHAAEEKKVDCFRVYGLGELMLLAGGGETEGKPRRARRRDPAAAVNLLAAALLTGAR